MASKPAGKLPAPPKPGKPAPKGNKGAGTTSTKRRTDWEAVERDYRTNQYTLRELAEKHGANHATIGRRAEREGWTRDLTDAIRQATNARLITEAVQQKCDDAQQNATTAVLVAAEANVHVILKHRTGLKRITSIKETLLNQIEQAAQNLPDLAEVIEMVRNPDENGVDRANDAMRKAMSRTALVDDLKKLTEVDERVRKGEREAFNIDAKGEDPDSQAGKTLTDAERAVRLLHFLKAGGAAA